MLSANVCSLHRIGLDRFLLAGCHDTSGTACYRMNDCTPKGIVKCVMQRYIVASFLSRFPFGNLVLSWDKKRAARQNTRHLTQHYPLCLPPPLYFRRTRRFFTFYNLLFRHSCRLLRCTVANLAGILWESCRGGSSFCAKLLTDRQRRLHINLLGGGKKRHLA